MEVYTPIELLNIKLAELKQIQGIDPNILLEYEKAILVLELIGSPAFDDIVSGSSVRNNSAPANHNESNKGSKSYSERFMEAQKNRDKKSK